MPKPPDLRPGGALLAALMLAPTAWAQGTAASPPAQPASAPGPLPAAAPAPAAAAPASAPAVAPATAPVPEVKPATGTAAPQRVEITGGRLSDDEQRRRSTAAKIVIGREEIDKFGDATVGEVLRRLPGVTTPGAPGRGGPPRMRGLGNGFTQLLIDGQRVPPGFSLESLTPEQIERIEILRAPTAETGARAIAGTINIITREGFRRRLNDLRLGLSVENGQVTPGLFWTHNNSKDALIYNISAAVFRPWRDNSSRTDSTVSDALSGVQREVQSESETTQERRRGLNLTGRLQWRLNEQGDMFMLMPTLFHGEGSSRSQSVLTQSLPVPALGPPDTRPEYDRSSSGSNGHNTSARLNLQWRQRLGGSRLELQGGVGNFESVSTSRREGSGGRAPQVVDNSSRTNDTSLNITAKLSSLVGGAGAAEGGPAAPGRPMGQNTPGGATQASGPTGASGPSGPAAGAAARANAGAAAGSEHSLVTGLELEAYRRQETRTSLINGIPQLTDFGDNLSASSLRLAAYAQDEWSLSPKWSFHAGLRWEGIQTEGEAQNGQKPDNRSSVTTPLLHLLWKPDPSKRDQVRLSLTRSYRAPALATLIARPGLNTKLPPPLANTPITADSAGNPNLRPELARGLDLAFERYLEGGGVLSANLFHRQITDVMRRVVALETVSWSPVPRYVARQENVGDAVTQGLELEAKFRLDQAIPDAPRVELRSNLSLYRSKVEGVPGPDNRLDSQAKATANVGADYRFRGTPLTLGGNLNWVPGYRTQQTLERSVTVSTKKVFDAYALWTFNPAVALRLLGSNLAPADYINGSVYNDGVLRTEAVNTAPTFINWQLRLELKL